MKPTIAINFKGVTFHSDLQADPFYVSIMFLVLQQFSEEIEPTVQHINLVHEVTNEIYIQNNVHEILFHISAFKSFQHLVDNKDNIQGVFNKHIDEVIKYEEELEARVLLTLDIEEEA